MRAYDIIYKKRQGHELTKEEIDFIIDGYMSNEVADYQISALLMAICINSMSEMETFYLTDAMLRSGDLIDLSSLGDKTVDKHSTGGVGDKTTLIVAPIAASLGCTVAKMSGRGLGHTGGTVDKLESIRGFKSSLSAEEFLKQVDKIGICVTGQSGNLAPADKKLYALRDVTATVDSIPLIASSIMSKKLASGSQSIVLDVKCGSGAFMKTPEEAFALAKAMIDIGKGFKRGMHALITNMDAPLGRFVGNSLEIYEAIQVLSGSGDANLTELCVAISANMVALAHKIDLKEATKRVCTVLENGLALNKMLEWISAQGGDASLLENPRSLLSAKYKKEFKASKCGFITKVNAELVGVASMLLGAGRAKKEDTIDPLAGIELKHSYGDYVQEGDVIAVMYSSNEGLFGPSEEKLKSAFSICTEKPQKITLIYDIL